MLFRSGFTVWKGKKQVYLQVASAAGKPADYLTLSEDEAQGDIQVIEIDPKKETVKLNNAGQEMTLNFKDNGAKSTAPAPGAPGAPGMPNAIPGASPTGIANNPFNPRAPRPMPAGPTVIGRGGVTETDPSSLPGGVTGAQTFPGGLAVPLSSPAFSSTLPGANTGIPSSSSPAGAAHSVTVGGQDLNQTTAIPMVPGQDRIINGRRIPAPPPLPGGPVPVPVPGN